MMRDRTKTLLMRIHLPMNSKKTPDLIRDLLLSLRDRGVVGCRGNDRPGLNSLERGRGRGRAEQEQERAEQRRLGRTRPASLRLLRQAHRRTAPSLARRSDFPDRSGSNGVAEKPPLRSRQGKKKLMERKREAALGTTALRRFAIQPPLQQTLLTTRNSEKKTLFLSKLPALPSLLFVASSWSSRRAGERTVRSHRNHFSVTLSVEFWP